jgi:hypothetical protein
MPKPYARPLSLSPSNTRIYAVRALYDNRTQQERGATLTPTGQLPEVRRQVTHHPLSPTKTKKENKMMMMTSMIIFVVLITYVFDIPNCIFSFVLSLSLSLSLSHLSLSLSLDTHTYACRSRIVSSYEITGEDPTTTGARSNADQL